VNPKTTINIVSFITFTSALSTRAADPVIPQLAQDFWIDPSTAAMLGAAFAAYGLVQPVLGPVADAVGKMRVMTVCLAVLAAASFLCAGATSWSMMFVMRVIAGAACGGGFPVALAIVADLVPVEQRQVVIGRLLAATISGNLLGAAAAGVVADVIHWRGVFALLGVFTVIALVLAVISLRNIPRSEPHPLDPLSVIRRFRSIFGIRTARVCYLSVALEGLFLFGVFPYVAVLLSASGETRASIAGLVIAAFALGGTVYSLSVSWLLSWLGQKGVMIGGALVVAASLLVVAFQPSWQVQAAAFATMGCGFYMLHGTIQVFVTELAPATRSSAVAFHTFSFFVGQGIGPIAFGFGLSQIGAPMTLVISAVAMMLIGIVSAQLLLRYKGT
jgi:predicted MFS family arabinose efflux permease